MDKSMLGDMDGLPEEDKIRIATMVDQLQIRDSLRMYNSLVERCFTDCVDTFRRKNLDKQEESCVRHCTEKNLDKQEDKIRMATMVDQLQIRSRSTPP